jgi:hypothetical protein
MQKGEPVLGGLAQRAKSLPEKSKEPPQMQRILTTGIVSRNTLFFRAIA